MNYWKVEFKKIYRIKGKPPKIEIRQYPAVLCFTTRRKLKQALDERSYLTDYQYKILN